MKKITLLTLTGLSLIGGSFVSLDSHSSKVTTLSRFDNQIIRKPFALVCFYQEDRAQHKDKNYREQIKTMQRGINSLGRLRRYRESGLNYISANAAQDDIGDAAQRYGVTQYPTFVLFKFGRPVQDKDNKVVMLKGFVSNSELQDFIETNIGDDLAKERERWAQDRLIRAEAAAYYWSTPYWGGYWGYPYYWRRPYVGFGFGYYV